MRGWVVDTTGVGGLQGYYLPDLGDGAVAALTPEVGVELLRLRMSVCGGGVVIPTGNRAGMKFLADQGAEILGSAPRMVRNGDDPLAQSLLFQRVGGHCG
jgi:hypothetical protein